MGYDTYSATEHNNKDLQELGMPRTDTRMRNAFVAVSLLLIGSVALFARADESLDALKTRADAAAGAQRVSLCLQVAERQLRAADRLYTEGKVEDAHSAVHDLVDYSDKATQTATDTGKKLKDAEISVRKMAHKLADIKRTLNLEDQQPVQDAVDHLEHLRTSLLSKMFGSGKK